MSISASIPKRSSEPNPSVFINCPFDRGYVPCFEALIFTITASGYRVRCALEDDDGANIRFGKLLRLIRESRRTIHDLSRIELGPSALPRFNMPFELGLAVDAKHFGNPKQRKKTALVMVRANHALPTYLSDMGGSDQQAHNNDPSEAMRVVGRYLHQTPEGGPVPGRNWLVNSLALFKREVLPARSLSPASAVP